MSSFLCGIKHFNSIEQGIIKLVYKKDFYFDYAVKQIFPILGERSPSIKNVEKTVFGIVDEIRKLSALCVNLQYKHKYEGRLDEEIKHDTEKLLSNKSDYENLSLIGLYKAISCALYQIETEHIKEIRELSKEEENALKFMELLSNNLANHIVCRTKEFNEGSWAIDLL